MFCVIQLPVYKLISHDGFWLAQFLSGYHLCKFRLAPCLPFDAEHRCHYCLLLNLGWQLRCKTWPQQSRLFVSPDAIWPRLSCLLKLANNETDLFTILKGSRPPFFLRPPPLVNRHDRFNSSAPFTCGVFTYHWAVRYGRNDSYVLYWTLYLVNYDV